MVISHHHPDHWTDLYAWTPRPGSAAAASPLPVYAPAEVAGRADRRADPARLARRDRRRRGPASARPRCAFHRTDHGGRPSPSASTAAGRALGYSADTGPDWSPDELGTGLDLLLCEATYTAEHEGTAGHLSGRQAGAAARAAGARRLVLTHRWPTVDAAAVAEEAEAAFGGPVEQAAIGKEFAL